MKWTACALFTFLFGFLVGSAIFLGINSGKANASSLNNTNITHSNQTTQSTPILNVGTVLTPAAPLASFSLTDTHEQIFTESNLQGHWTILFFGYAGCPVVCPTSLAVASDFWKKIPASLIEQKKLQFVFVTLDPKQDKIPELRNFLNRFNTDFIGITGNNAELNKLAKTCRVYSWEDPKLNEKGQKIIDHTAAFILINPQGRMQALFSPPHNSKDIADDLKTIISG